LDFSLLLVELHEELSQDIDAGEYITEVALHDESFILVFEAGSLCLHLIEVFPF
jgi:hypothetical protein